MRIYKGAALMLSFMLTAACVHGCAPKIKVNNAVPNEKIGSDTLYVAKVENMPEDFILGMDASSVLAEEASGVRYYDFAGNEQDVFKTLAESGVNTVRVRVWNDPFDENGRGFGGGNCNIDTALEIGRRATMYGMGLLVDFHLSDFWADPGKQMVPRAWANMDIEEKTDAVYEYVRDSLKKLKKAGVNVKMVQIGNETNGALCGETIWFNIQYLMQAGSKACREVLPDALVALHFANPEKAGSYASYASKLAYYDVDYDVFASSYYPYWHGTLDNLAECLDGIAKTYGKKVMVMETSYAYTAEDTDFNGNTVSDGSGIVKPYPFSVQGQANNVREITDTVVNRMTNGIGVVYWEGAWISVGTDSWDTNHELWEKYGSGWASSYASKYDPDDAGRYFGGCAVDNQAMFYPDGRPLESLKVFNLMRWGNEIQVLPDAVDDTLIEVDLNGEIELPDTVMAVMTDNSRLPVPVFWNAAPSDLEDMKLHGPKTYTLTGDAEGLDATLYINMVEFNFLENPGFESGKLDPWTVTDHAHADELYVEDKLTDSKSGQWHMHFWSAAADSVDFTLEQAVEGLKAGDYKFTISIMGGDAGETDIYAYALIDGIEAARAPLGITSYGDWDTAVLHALHVEEGSTLTVGISVKCEGEGSGAWGKIDEAMLNSEG